jgi:hypothetical protein
LGQRRLGRAVDDPSKEQECNEVRGGQIRLNAGRFMRGVVGSGAAWADLGGARSDRGRHGPIQEGVTRSCGARPDRARTGSVWGSWSGAAGCATGM